MTAHIYGAGTRLSSAYTAGVDGKRFAKHFGDKKSAAYRAWQEGRIVLIENTINRMAAARYGSAAIVSALQGNPCNLTKKQAERVVYD